MPGAALILLPPRAERHSLAGCSHPPHPQASRECVTIGYAYIVQPYRRRMDSTLRLLITFICIISHSLASVIVFFKVCAAVLTAAGVPPLWKQFLNNPQAWSFKFGEINVPLGWEEKRYFRNISMFIIAAYYSCIYFIYCAQSGCASDFFSLAQHFVWVRWEGNRYFLARPWLCFTRSNCFLVQWTVNHRKRPGVPRCSSLMQTEMKWRHPPPPSSLLCRSTVFPHSCTPEPDDAVWL